jgi:hypothetical protein
MCHVFVIHNSKAVSLPLSSQTIFMYGLVWKTGSQIWRQIWPSSIFYCRVITLFLRNSAQHLSGWWQHRISQRKNIPPTRPALTFAEGWKVLKSEFINTFPYAITALCCYWHTKTKQASSFKSSRVVPWSCPDIASSHSESLLGIQSNWKVLNRFNCVIQIAVRDATK